MATVPAGIAEETPEEGGEERKELKVAELQAVVAHLETLMGLNAGTMVRCTCVTLSSRHGYIYLCHTEQQARVYILVSH
jgi:hypothetical protein